MQASFIYELYNHYALKGSVIETYALKAWDHPV